MNLAIIIPVYNGFKESIECIKSVLKNTDKTIPIIILDDASPKGDFRDLISKEIKITNNLHLKRFKQNGGYVKAVNFGMKYGELITDITEYKVSHNELKEKRGIADCILLNSDTIVTKNWISKLNKAAYSSDKIGTVTPYSNNAILASFPRFCRPNNISISQIEDLNSKIEKYSPKKYPELPTSMGFCNYIRRDTLDVLGYYNEKDFGLGNGEENDFSMRAHKAGYKNILDDSTYIFHIGEVSFAERKKDFEEKNGDILNKLHPEYLPKITAFCSNDPNKKYRNEILDKIFTEKKRKNRILHILHNGPYFSRTIEKVGGTELHVQDLINNLTDFNHCSLVADYENYYLTFYFEELEREFKFKKSEVSLFDIINSKNFKLIHLHHSLNYDKFELISALKTHGNYLVSAHDYNSICPRNILITPNGSVCSTKECESSCGYLNSFMEEYRKEHLSLFKLAKKTICFSKDTKSRLEKVLKTKLENSEIIHHGVELSKEKIDFNPIKDKLKILMLGVLAPHKGLELIKELGEKLSLISNTEVELHFLGRLNEDPKLDFIINHGEYQREDLYEKIMAINPHIALLGSICFETYSLTLDELVSCGIPTIVGNKGAPAERIKANNSGWVLEELNITNLIEQLNSIVSNKDEYKSKYHNAKNSELMSKVDEANYYMDFYPNTTNDSNELPATKLKSFFENINLKKENKLKTKIINKIKPKIVKLAKNEDLKHKIKALIPKAIYFKLKKNINKS